LRLLACRRIIKNNRGDAHLIELHYHLLNVTGVVVANNEAGDFIGAVI